MAIEKYSKRDDAMSNKMEDYVRIAHIMAECDAENVRVIKSKISEDEAKAKLEAFLNTKDISVSRGLPAKLIDAIRKAGEPKIRKEYFSVIASYFNLSSVEFSYSYMYNGNLINMSPRRYNIDMDFSVFVETLDGRYHQTIMGKKTPMDNMWDGLLQEELTDDFEEGFVAHNLLPEDSERESKESMRLLHAKFKDRLMDVVQEEKLNNSKAREVSNVNIIDKEYTYTTYVFAAPFYVFQYDLGKKVVTITVDAYSGEISTPIVNNPLARVLFAHELEEPSFNLILCILCGCIVPIAGAAVYAFSYLSKKSKYEKSTFAPVPKYNLNELKNLM